MLAVRVRFALRRPGEFDWAQDDEFNARMHQRLMAAHELVAESTPEVDKRPEAEKILLRLRVRLLSPRQAMLRYYLLAQCARGHDLAQSRYFLQPLQWCGRAERIAGALVDRRAQVDLHELRGTLHRSVSMYAIAAEEFSLALRLLREEAEDEESVDADFEVTLASKAATMDYFAGNIPRALEHAERAERLLPLTATSVEGRGTLAWTFALLQRQHNDVLEALRHADEAVQLYRQLEARNSTCRILSLAADIAMDAAESPAGEIPVAREEYLAQATCYADEAFLVGRTVGDNPGLQLVELSRIRLDRLNLVDNAAERKARLRAVLAFALQAGDDSLLVAAQTATGSDLLARSLTRRGKTWLKQAVATAERIDSVGLAFVAQRLLRKAEGRNV